MFDRKAYRQSPERKAKDKLLRQTPKYKAIAKEAQRKYLANLTPERRFAREQKSANTRKKNHPIRVTLSAIRSRCKKKGLNFNLTEEYLTSIWTGKCPVFGFNIVFTNKGSVKANSATIDKLIPHLGYVIGNVVWLSQRANQIKTDATYEEVQRVADFMKEKLAELKEKSKTSTGQEENLE